MGPTFPVYSKGLLKKLNDKKREKLRAAVRSAFKDDPKFEKVLKPAITRMLNPAIKKAKAKTMPTYRKLLRSP
jgi:hypothetical protein